MSQTVLIVDDFSSVRLYHSGFLTRKGYVCLGARDGAEALDILSRQPVDLVLLDMVMPNVDGDEFARRLSTHPEFSALPLLVITSEGPHAQEVFAQGGRPVGVLTKPVMPDVLLQHVKQLLAPEDGG
jgi:CheY-like chemotaxis protein